MEKTALEELVCAQDHLVSASGIDIWVGMEPTFTRRFAETPEWLSEATGEEKLAYAYRLLCAVCRDEPGGVVLHTLGRQYAGEDLPRWSLGYYQARTRPFTWEGPPDPCLLSNPAESESTYSVTTEAVERFWRELNDTLNHGVWQSRSFRVEQELRYRLLLRHAGETPLVDLEKKPQLGRASIHASKIPLHGLVDDLAADGDLLLCLDIHRGDGVQYSGTSIVVELPGLADVGVFIQLLHAIGRAARRCGIESLIFQGFPPPVDSTVAWATITPDPAVIEVNMAPSENAANFYARCKRLYSAAEEVGLCPYRLHYNGVVADSGGGGQLTLGGPEPLLSPFFRSPQLLPRLVRYFNAHPALSYWFAQPSIGGSSQSPRADEGDRESFREMSLALDQLEARENPDPEFIWRSLSPFLADPSGNPHRSELNIEKLWNPYLPGRGRMGLVEFRAFRMSRSADCAVAIAALLRGLVAMLNREDKAPRLINHGLELHDRYALPFYLQADLNRVFSDLKSAGFPLHKTLQTILLQEPIRLVNRAEFQGCTLELQQALEFWPLVGDVASQESGGSRLVDASTIRLQVLLRVASQHPTELEGYEVWIDGFRIPFREEQDRRGPLKVTGLRYRNFVPWIGLHPGIAPRDSITLVLAHRGRDQALEITYQEWHPHGLAYPGLPPDLEDAEKRRAERLTSRIIPFENPTQSKPIPDPALTEYCLDLRWLPA
ncbi:MAG: transglutaminase family protein [Gammaproteobacteria bacterium]